MRRLFDPARNELSLSVEALCNGGSCQDTSALDPSKSRLPQVRVLWVDRSVLLPERQKRFTASCSRFFLAAQLHRRSRLIFSLEVTNYFKISSFL